MIKKRFTLSDEKYNETIFDNGKSMGCIDVVDMLNALNEENEWLFKCVENQSALIHELDSVIMAYNMDHKIVIKLTEKDLRTLDKALSYYTHQEV